MKRALTLTNSRNETIDLLDDRHLFVEISDFGFSLTNTYQTIGSNFLLTNSEYTQTGIKGTMYFKGDDPYQDYFDFINNYTNQDLTLVYHSARRFNLPCRLVATSKKENTKDYRRVEVTFVPTNLWYLYLSDYYEPTEIESSGKIYSYEYPYRYGEGTGEMSVTLTTDTNIPSPVKLTIYGTCTNPQWTQYVGGQKVATGAMRNTTIGEYERLVVDATSVNNLIELRNNYNQPIGDLYQKSDFGTERFLYLRKGQNKFVLTTESSEKVLFVVEAHALYESV